MTQSTWYRLSKAQPCPSIASFIYKCFFYKSRTNHRQVSNGTVTSMLKSFPPILLPYSGTFVFKMWLLTVTLLGFSACIFIFKVIISILSYLMLLKGLHICAKVQNVSGLEEKGKSSIINILTANLYQSSQYKGVQM